MEERVGSGEEGVDPLPLEVVTDAEACAELGIIFCIAPVLSRPKLPGKLNPGPCLSLGLSPRFSGVPSGVAMFSGTMGLNAGICLM